MFVIFLMLFTTSGFCIVAGLVSSLCWPGADRSPRGAKLFRLAVCILLSLRGLLWLVLFWIELLMMVCFDSLGISPAPELVTLWFLPTWLLGMTKLELVPAMCMLS